MTGVAAPIAVNRTQLDSSDCLDLPKQYGDQFESAQALAQALAQAALQHADQRVPHAEAPPHAQPLAREVAQPEAATLRATAGPMNETLLVPRLRSHCEGIRGNTIGKGGVIDR